jgi:outer membrane protein insertion porin family
VTTILQRLITAACLTGMLATLAPAQDALPSKQRTTIRIRGVQSITERQALELLGDRLTFARSKPPTQALAEDAAFMLRRLLENQGFANPSVAASFGAGTIFLDVTEGSRLTLGSVYLPDPEKKEAARLSELFSSISSKNNRLNSQQTPFRESNVDEGLDIILADFHSRGYWAAEAKVEKRATDPKTGEVNLIIRTKPGPLHQLGTASFQGDSRGMTGQLTAVANAFRGMPATTNNINGLRASVEDVFRRSGFKKAGIRMSVEPSGSTLAPVFTITAGTRYRRGELDIVGLERTRHESVLRFADGLEGEYYDESEVERRIRGLLGTGAFSGVQIDTTPRGDFLDATLSFTEGQARGYSVYGGFGNYDGSILGGRYYDRNFGGRLLNFSTGAEFNNRGILGEVKLIDPWFDGAGSKLGGRLFALTRDHEGYDKLENGAAISYTRMLAEKAPFTAEFGYSWVDTDPDGIPSALLGDTNYSHLYLRVTQQLDRRNDPLLPTRGWQFSGAAEAGLASGSSQVGYLKLEAAASWHTPVAENNHLSLGLRAGSIMHSSTPNGLPIDLRYFLGGPDSVRSFPERELGPHAPSNDPLGGEAYWVFNAEYVHQLSGPLKLVVFTDAGGLSRSFEDQGFDEVEVAAGLGLRLDLPVGPIRLEYGHNLTRDTNEPSGTWHLAIGIAF